MLCRCRRRLPTHLICRAATLPQAAAREFDWPVLKSYGPSHLRRIAMPLGGMGAGSISIGGCGDLRDFELFNRPAKGFVPSSRDVAPCVMLHIRRADGRTDLRLAEGPIDSETWEGSVGCRQPNHGIPRFNNCHFDAAYPLAQVRLSDEQVPVSVRLQAFSPVIPGNADDSSQPVIQLRYLLQNESESPLDVATIATMPNLIGMLPETRELLGNGRVRFHGPEQNRIEVRDDGKLRGLYFSSTGTNTSSESFGTFALLTHADNQSSTRTNWLDNRYYSGLLDLRNDLDRNGQLSERAHNSADIPVGSLAVHHKIQPGESKVVTFFLSWHFPNRMDWTPDKHDELVGNWYTSQYRDAWHAAELLVPRMPQLERSTVQFVRAICTSDLPPAIKEASLFNISSLFSETCHRLPDGTFCSYEGCGDNKAYCEGSCTHVWNYDYALAFLWGDLARSMRDVEYRLATGERGDMAFRVMQPFASRARDFPRVAADGQLGCIGKVYREWQLSGDTEWLLGLWPQVRKSLEYCWISGGWDADRDGLMEGCQHNTMDVEYCGPNPQMQFWYLLALKAATTMALAAGDAEFATECERLFAAGRHLVDKRLFNGEYYEQEFIEPSDPAKIPPEQRLFDDKPVDKTHQLLDACLVDQCVGQLMAHILGLGYLGKRENIRTALASVFRYNGKKGFHNHLNVMRSFVLGDEAGLLMASFPRGEREDFPFPYFSEVMSGFEYTAAAGMIYEGLEQEALECVENIRARYDGRKRNPFDEAECGHHYIRALSSWATGIAWTGFRYSAISKIFRVRNRSGRWFWSNGNAWGQYEIEGQRIHLSVLYGTLAVSEFVVAGAGRKQFSASTMLETGATLSFDLDAPCSET